MVGNDPDGRTDADEVSPGVEGDDIPSRMIKVEANLLRLPLFALHTRGLGTLDGIECRGKTNRDGVAREYTFASTRNTATLYPGPLARAVHMAFLEIVSDGGLPLENPVTWTWRDLCRRLGITYSGRTVGQLKAAIHATQGLMIRSQYALYSKSEGKLIHTLDRSVALYEDVSFACDSRSASGAVETNRVWLSRWYLDNLNSFYTAPLDYGLWRHLDGLSTIASRLYEFLLLSFYGDAPFLRINYKNLAQFLPVRIERYVSNAKKQIGPALEHLRETGVVEKVVWSEGKDKAPQLHFFRGRRLTSARTPVRAAVEFREELSGVIEVAEFKNQRPPEWGLVEEFYRAWTDGEPPRPSAKELQQARELVQLHGVTKAKTVVQLATKRMRVEWPQAKTFSALLKFVGEASKDADREQRKAEGQRREQTRKAKAKAEQEHRDAEWLRFEATWTPVWDSLPEAGRDAIRRAILKQSPYLAKSPRILKNLCLEELAKRSGVETDS